MTARTTLPKSKVKQIFDPGVRGELSEGKRRGRPPAAGGPKKERISSYIERELMERARRAAYWTPGLTVAALLEKGLAVELERLEKKRGSPFPPKDGES